MKDIIYRCNNTGCTAVRTDSDSGWVALIADEKKITILRFTDKLGDKHPVFCGDNCLHKHLSVKLRELT